MNAFTVVFLVALGLGTAIRIWLGARHLRHVAANRNTVPAEFRETISLPMHQKAADYTAAKTRLGLVDALVSAAVLLGFTLGGGLEALFDGWGAIAEPGGYVQGLALMLSVAAITSLVGLPFSMYRTFVIEERFGFNRMTLRLFVVDLLKQTAIGLALAVPLIVGILWLMGRMGDFWWLYVWAAWVAFGLAIHFVYPSLIAPLFNKFTPLTDEALTKRIENLLAKCGFRSKGLYVMDGSLRSSHGNAYFTGLGAAKRIVFFDTLLARLAPAEVEAVLAHELAHFKYRHVWKRMAWMFVASFAFFAVLGLLMDAPWFYDGLGVDRRSTALALLLLLMIVPVFTFVLHPIGSVYSRRHEYQADAYAAAHSNGGDLVQALVKLYQDNATTLTPDPVHSAFYDSHPPAILRIARLQALSHPG